MTLHKNILKRTGIVATSSAAIVALALAAPSIFEPSREFAAGQSPTSNADAQSALPSTDASAVPAISNFDPDPLKLRTNAAQTPVIPVQTNLGSGANGVDLNGNNSKVLETGFGDFQTQLTALQDKAKALQAQLRKTPTSAEEQQNLQQVAMQLADVQREIQQLELNSGQYAAYRRARDQEQGIGIDPNKPSFRAKTDPYQFGAQNLGTNPFQANFAQDRAQALSESGLDQFSFANRAKNGSTSFGEAELLREQKEGLTQQYRQLQQTLRALNPNDEALASGLKQEQATLLAQLKEIDAKLANVANSETLDMQTIPSAEQFTIPEANRLPSDLDPQIDPSSVATRMQKVSDATRLLREAGLVQLANYAEIELPKLADPNYKEQRLVPGAWTEGDGLAEERHNPFQQISPEDVQKIADSVVELQSKIEAMSTQLEDVNSQLKLLTRSSAQLIDNNATPVSVTAEIPTATPTTDAQAPEASASDVQPTEAQENGFQTLMPEVKARPESTPADALPTDPAKGAVL